MERIYDLASERVLQNCIDGEVASSRSFFQTHRRIAFDEEGSMAAARLAFAARQRNIEARTDFVDGECFADNIDIAEPVEDLAQSSGFNVINFEVPILRLRAHQRIPHTTAHQQRAAASVEHGFAELQNLVRDVH